MVSDWDSGYNSWSSMGNYCRGLNLGHDSGGLLHHLGHHRCCVESGDGGSSQMSSIQTKTMIASTEEKLRVSISSRCSIAAGNTDAENSLARKMKLIAIQKQNSKPTKAFIFMQVLLNTKILF